MDAALPREAQSTPRRDAPPDPGAPAIEPPATQAELYREGNLALHEGRYREARELFRRLRKMNPSETHVSVKLHLATGHMYRAEQDFDRAIAAFQEACGVDPLCKEAIDAIRGCNEAQMQASSGLFKRLLGRK